MIINIRSILCENTIKTRDQVAEANKVFPCLPVIVTEFVCQVDLVDDNQQYTVDSLDMDDINQVRSVKIFNSLIQYPLDPTPPLPSILSIIKKLMCRPPCSDVILAHTPEKWKSILYAGCGGRGKAP